jgi:hypothetical protein
MSSVEYNIKTRTIKGPIDDVMKFVDYVNQDYQKTLPVDEKLLHLVQYDIKNRVLQGQIDNVMNFVNYIQKIDT